MRRSFLLALALIVVAGTVSAQSGSVEGTVTDPTGAVIPNATVRATNVATTVVTTRQTDAAGLFVLTLAPGNYSIQADATGFQSLARQLVTVDALATVPLNLKLTNVANTTTQVTVNADITGLQTEDVTLGTTVRNVVFSALPLPMAEGTPRNPTSLITLSPGVSTYVLESAGPSFSSFNGSRQEVYGMYYEGLPMTFSNQQGDTRPIALATAVDAINQFQVEVNGEQAMWQGQGFHNYTIKNGTDQFHGTLYEYFRNTALDARNYFFKFVPTDHQNEYGGNIGGPIIKGKLFFFGNYDKYDFDTATSPQLLSVPSAGELSGDFSALPTPIYDPTTQTCTGAICTKTQFQYNGKLNVIPPSGLSKISQSFDSYLPAATLPGFLNNYAATLPRKLWNQNTTDRFDYDLSSKDRMYFVYAYGEWLTDYTGNITPTGTALPLPYTASPGIVEELPWITQFHDDYTFSSSLFNSFGIGMTRLSIPILPITQYGDFPAKAGLTGLPGNGQAAKGFPGTTFSGPNPPSSWSDTGPFNEFENDYVGQDSLEWVRGNHVFTFGGQFTTTQDNLASPTDGTDFNVTFSNNSTAGYSSTGSLLTGNTGNAFADFLLGDVDSANVVHNSLVEYGSRYSNFSFFGEDNWKVTRKLSLNLGVRWDVYKPFHEQHNRDSYMSMTLANPSAGNIPGALVYGSLPLNTHYKDVQPRVGLAYQLDDKTVIRAGFLVAQSTGNPGVGGNSGAGPGDLGYNPPAPIASTVTGQPAFNWNSGVPTPVTPAPLLSAGYGAGNSTTNPSAAITPAIIIPALSARPPEYINWSLGFQRQLPYSLVLTATYSASEGHFLSTYTAIGSFGDNMPVNYLALGSLLNATATPANVAAAQAMFPSIALPFSNFKGTIAQMLKPYPQYTNTTCYSCEEANSIYNSMQVSLVRRFNSGLNLQVAYTLAKEKDDGQNSSGQLGAVGGGSRDPFNAKYDYGFGEVDHRNDLHVTFVYPIPVGNAFSGGAAQILRTAISDWSLSGIYTYETGAPVGVTGSGCTTPGITSTCMVSVNPNFSGNIYNQKIGTGNVLTTDYINKSAFMDPAPYTFGNEVRSSPFGLTIPTNWEFDGTVRRSIPIHDRLQFQFAADFFNLFNNVVFSAPATNIDSANFGEVSSTQNQAREIQFEGRFTF